MSAFAAKGNRQVLMVLSFCAVTLIGTTVSLPVSAGRDKSKQLLAVLPAGQTVAGPDFFSGETGATGKTLVTFEHGPEESEGFVGGISPCVTIVNVGHASVFASIIYGVNNPSGPVPNSTNAVLAGTTSTLCGNNSSTPEPTVENATTFYVSEVFAGCAAGEGAACQFYWRVDQVTTSGPEDVPSSQRSCPAGFAARGRCS